MKDVLLKIVETQPAPNRAWTSELWSGFPGDAGAVKLAGAGQFTQVQLETPLAGGTAMDQAAVLNKIRTEDKVDTTFSEIGLRLYQLLESTDTANAWRALRDQEELAGSGLRTYLELPDYIDEWPWELLAWPVPAGYPVAAFIAPKHPMLRLALPGQVAAWNESTVRILLVSGQEALDPADRDNRETLASTELRKIRRIFQDKGLSVVVDLCQAPDLEVLKKRIESMAPHILHFIAHGDIQPNVGFVLQFLTQKKSLKLWSSREIQTFFQNLSAKPRLVVLNSCNSARREANAVPVAKVLLGAGVPAVIASLAALQIDYARSFSEAFYGSLADGETVERAIVSARDKMAGSAQYGLERRHWALPILTVRSRVEVVRLTPASPVLNRCEVAQVVFKRPGAFVNRASDRWSMLSAFSPALAAGRRFRGLILEGNTQVGKSWLMMRAMRDFIDSGVIVRYAELVGPEDKRDSLDVLEDWRGRAKFQSPVLSRLPGPHFDAFDRALLATRQPGGLTAQNIGETLQAFKAGFQSYRGGKNVLLVIGRFRSKGRANVSNQDFREYLLEKLLLPMRAVGTEDPETSGLHCLLIVRRHKDLQSGQESDFDEFALNRVSDDVPDEDKRKPADGFLRLTLGEFSSDEVDQHFDEFSQFREDIFFTSLREAFRASVGTPPTDWSPLMLQDFERTIDRYLSKQPKPP